MNILPSKCSSFRNPEYWRHFYSKLDTFDWYVDYNDIEAALFKIIYERSCLNEFFSIESLLSYEKILENKNYYKSNINTNNITIINIGSGNSLMPLELEKQNFNKIISIDFEQSVIAEMKKYETKVLKWECIDVSTDAYLDLFKKLNCTYKILLDKAFLDAYISKYSDEPDLIIRNKAKSYLKNNISLLNVGDVFIIISLLQPYIIKEIIRNIFSENILIDIYPIINSNNNIKLIPYAIAIYRIDFQVYDKRRCRVYGVAGVPSRHFSAFELLKVINEINFNYYVFNSIKIFNPGRKIIFHVDSNDSDISYSVAIYDSNNFIKNHENLKNAVIIVPPGYEQSQLFSTIQGNEQLSSTSKCNRLIIVSFNWLDSNLLEFDYQQLLNRVKSDLNPLLLKLSTSNDIPIMTCEDDVKIKKFVAKIQSMQSYTILIRDLITSESNVFNRQLIFNTSPHTIQSEVCYKSSGGDELFLFNKPCLEHHMAICICMINAAQYSDNNANHNNIKSNVAILGSGVNVLSNIINNLIQDKYIYHCVDIDSQVIKLSSKYFGNDLSNFIKLNEETFSKTFIGNIINIEGDAIEYIKMATKYQSSYNAIILDINNEDYDNMGIYAPNTLCIGDEFLNNINKLLTDRGLFIVNAITIENEGYITVANAFKKHFKFIKIISMPDVANKVFICTNFKFDLIINSIESLDNKLVNIFSIDEWTVSEY